MIGTSAACPGVPWECRHRDRDHDIPAGRARRIAPSGLAATGRPGVVRITNVALGRPAWQAQRPWPPPESVSWPAATSTSAASSAAPVRSPDARPSAPGVVVLTTPGPSRAGTTTSHVHDPADRARGRPRRTPTRDPFLARARRRRPRRPRPGRRRLLPRAGVGPRTRRRPGPRCPAAPRLLPEHHPRRRPHRRAERAVRAEPRPDQARDPDLQRGPRGDRRPARELDRHRLHRLRPGDQRLQAEPRRHPRDLRRHVGRRPARRAARHHEPAAAPGEEDRDAAAREHPGHLPQEVAQAETTCRSAPGRGPSRSSTSTTPARWTPTRPASSTADGCPSRTRRSSCSRPGRPS